jgi:hypothetical protein
MQADKDSPAMREGGRIQIPLFRQRPDLDLVFVQLAQECAAGDLEFAGGSVCHNSDGVVG